MEIIREIVVSISIDTNKGTYERIIKPEENEPMEAFTKRVQEELKEQIELHN